MDAGVWLLTGMNSFVPLKITFLSKLHRTLGAFEHLFFVGQLVSVEGSPLSERLVALVAMILSSLARMCTSEMCVKFAFAHVEGIAVLVFAFE